MTTEERLALHAYLEPETHEAWNDWALEIGVSVTAILEALGRTIREHPEDWNRWTNGLQITRQARRIDAERRRRGGSRRRY